MDGVRQGSIPLGDERGDIRNAGHRESGFRGTGDECCTEGRHALLGPLIDITEMREWREERAGCSE